MCFNYREKLSSHQTNSKKSLNPQFEEEFLFPNYSLEQMKILSIRLSVYAKRKQFAKRQLVGDFWVQLSRPDFEPDEELICSQRLSLACLRTGKRVNNNYYIIICFINICIYIITYITHHVILYYLHIFRNILYMI